MLKTKVIYKSYITMQRLLLFISIIIISTMIISCEKPASPNPNLVNVKKGDVISYKVVLPTGASQMRLSMLMYVDSTKASVTKSDYLIMDSSTIYSFPAANDSQPAELTFTSGIGSVGAKMQIWLNTRLAKESVITSVNQTGFLSLP